MDNNIIFMHSKFTDLVQSVLDTKSDNLLVKKKQGPVINELKKYKSDKFNSLLNVFYKNKIVNCSIIKEICGYIENNIEIHPNGYVISDGVKICKIDTWEILKNMSVSISMMKNNNCLESGNIIMSKNIYDSFFEELNGIDLVFKVSMFNKFENFKNHRTIYYEKINTLQNKYINFINDYSFLNWCGGFWRFGDEINNAPNKQFFASLMTSYDLLIDETNVDRLLDSKLIDILMSTNQSKAIRNVKDLERFLSNVKRIEYVINKKLLKISSDKVLNLKIELNSQHLGISINNTYKEYCRTYFECDPKDVLNFNCKNILESYYSSDKELQKHCSFLEFTKRPLNIIKVMSMIHY